MFYDVDYSIKYFLSEQLGIQNPDAPLCRYTSWRSERIYLFHKKTAFLYVKRHASHLNTHIS